MNYDDEVLGVGNPLHPANQEEIEELKFCNSLNDSREVIVNNVVQDLIFVTLKLRDLELHELADTLARNREKLTNLF